MLTAAGIDTAGPGVHIGKSAKALASDLVAAMGRHRVWERANRITASAVSGDVLPVVRSSR